MSRSIKAVRVSRKRQSIPRRAASHKSRQLPHILKHFTFIIICTSILLFVLSSVFYSSALAFDAIVLLVGCVIIDGIALAL